MVLPKELYDEIFGKLHLEEDDDGKYSGEIEINNEMIPITFYIDPEEYETSERSLSENAHKALAWIKLKRKWLIEQAAIGLIYKYDNQDEDHPMWTEILNKKLAKACGEMKIYFISFYNDISFSISINDGGLYWGSEVMFGFDEPNENNMAEFAVFNSDFGD